MTRTREKKDVNCFPCSSFVSPRYALGGVSGHAGVFSNAADIRQLMNVRDCFEFCLVDVFIGRRFGCMGKTKTF
jgi:hypothetical protein